MQINSKPSPICNMVKDKAIGAQKYFADTFNWMVSILNALTEYSGVEVKEMEVVKDVKYDPESHELKQYKETVYVIYIPNRSAEDGESVFVATPLSEEV